MTKIKKSKITENEISMRVCQRDNVVGILFQRIDAELWLLCNSVKMADVGVSRVCTASSRDLVCCLADPTASFRYFPLPHTHVIG